MRPNGAFTLLELLVLVVIVALSLSVLVASLSCSREVEEREKQGRPGSVETRPTAGPRISRPARAATRSTSVLERARQATCRANLMRLGKAMALYMGDEDYKTPRLAKDADPISGRLNGSGNTYDNIFPETPGGTDNSVQMAKVAMQNVWLMIRKGSITEEAFHCPSDTNWKERTENARKYGWEYKNNFSYGMHWPYEQTGGRQNPAALNTRLDGGVVIFADQNPATLAGLSRGKAVSSRDPVVAPSNHPRDGEAVLNLNGAVRFYKVRDEANGRPKDSKAGKYGDEIYEANGDGTMPQDGTGTPIFPGEWDTYIVPTVGKDSPP